MITQKQAENMVYESLLQEYPESEIAKMPYRVTVSDNIVICRGDGWEDRYTVEYMPQLMLTLYEKES